MREVRSAVESRIIRTSPLPGTKLAKGGPSRARHALTVPQVEALADAAGGGLVEVWGRLVETDGKTHQSSAVPLPRFVADEYAGLLASRPNDPDALVIVTKTGRPVGLPNFRRRLDLASGGACRVVHALHAAPHLCLAHGPAGRPGHNGGASSAPIRQCSFGSGADVVQALKRD